jgi:hypothetical protein
MFLQIYIIGDLMVVPRGEVGHDQVKNISGILVGSVLYTHPGTWNHQASLVSFHLVSSALVMTLSLTPV